MRWPWRRRPADPATGPDADDGGTPAPPPSEPVRRPANEWRELPALQAVSLGDASTAADPLRFVQTLATRWQVPPALEQLGHEQGPAAPSGSVLVAPAPPVVGYPDAPVPVWPTVVAATPEPEATAPWAGPARIPADGAAAVADAKVSRDERPDAGLIGVREPLALRAFGDQSPSGPTGLAVGPVGAAAPDDTDLPAPLPLLAPRARDAAEASTDDVEARPAGSPVALPAPSPAPRTAVPDELGTPPVPDEVVPAPLVRPLVGRTSVRTLDAGDLRAADTRPDDPSSPEPETDAPRARSAHMAPAGPPATSTVPQGVPQGVPDWFTSGAVQPRAADLPSTPDLFATGRDATAAPAPGRPAPRRPDHVPFPGDLGSEGDQPGRRVPDPPVARPRRVAWPQSEPDAEKADPPQPDHATGTTGAAASAGHRERVQPDPQAAVLPGTASSVPAADQASDGQGARPVRHSAHMAPAAAEPAAPAEQDALDLPVVRSAHRPVLPPPDRVDPEPWHADDTGPDQPAAARWTPQDRSDRTDRTGDGPDDAPDGEETASGAPSGRRVLTMGAPLPPPARGVRPAVPMQGLAAFVAAASGPPPEPDDGLGGASRSGPSAAEGSDPPATRPSAADVLEMLRPRAADREEVDAAPSSPREPATPQPWPDVPPAAPVHGDPRTALDDLDDEPPDDDEDASAAAVYEQVRERLRHELLVERERAALLAD